MSILEPQPADDGRVSRTYTENSSGSHDPESSIRRRKKRSFPQFPRVQNVEIEQPSLREQETPLAIGEAFLSTTNEIITEILNSHKSYTPPGLLEAITDQPKFDEICRYGISPSQEEQLWQLEVRRLMSRMAPSSDSRPFRLSLKEELPADKSSMERIATVADRAICNLAICSLDNQLILFEHQQESFNSNIYFASRRAISQRFSPKETSPVSPHDKSAKLTEQDRRLYFTLVDYITAVIGQYACRVMPNEFWHTRALAALAKCAAKLKFLATDPEKFAYQSLDHGWDVLATYEARAFIGLMQNPNSEHATANSDMRVRLTNMPAVENLLSADEADTDFYFNEMAVTSSWAIDTMMSIFGDLKGGKVPGFSTDVFDMCSIVYKTGQNDVPTLISQDRHGEITGTSARSSLRTSYEIFRIISQVIRTIPIQPETRPVSSACQANIFIAFRMSEGEQMKDGEVEKETDAMFRNSRLIRLDDVLSVMVPLLCTQPGPLSQMNRVLNFMTETASLSSSIGFIRIPIIKFSATLSLRSDEYHQKLVDKAVDVFPLSTFVSTYPNRLNVVFEGKPESSGKSPTTCSEERRGVFWLPNKWDVKSTKSSLVYQSVDTVDRETVADWVIEENSIVVMRRKFVAAVMTACGILVVGGISSAFLIGERIAGVDPFNIATFTWILAGFLILLAKSLSVREWHWRDFLRGRVSCRSVSELHTVTGVDAQDIIEHLLSKESYHILTTKGPFNQLFSRRSENGFSIDVQSELRTLVASGIVVVKVASYMGPALVCLDIRRGMEGRTAIRHSDRPRKGERLIGCFDFPEAFDEGQNIPLQELSESMTWTRVLGLYYPGRRLNQKFR